MKKIKLNLNDLKVNSFATIQPESKTGTINGYRPPLTEDPKECKTDFDWNTCDHTCWDSCNTCIDTCDILVCQDTLAGLIPTCCEHCI